METARINGCEVRTYSRRARKCRDCQYNEYCREKQKEAAALIPFIPIPAGARVIYPEATAGRTAGEMAEAANQLAIIAAKAGTSMEDFKKAYWAAHSDPLNRPAALRGGDWINDRRNGELL